MSDLPPSRTEFERLANLVDTLGKRIIEQAGTIETLSKRLDQAIQKPLILINGKLPTDCTADEIDRALSALMFAQ